MTGKKNINDQVAEALGCRLVWIEASSLLRVADPKSGFWSCGCDEYGVVGPHGCYGYGVSKYDTDWSATGPLIEKYGIEIAMPFKPQNGMTWVAITKDTTDLSYGPTPLIAVCNLILALKEAGKL